MKFSNEFVAAMYRPYADASKRPAKEKDVEGGYLYLRHLITARATEPKLTSTVKLSKFSEPTPSGGSLTIFPNEGNSNIEVISKQAELERCIVDLGWEEKEATLRSTMTECEMKIAKLQAHVDNKISLDSGKKFDTTTIDQWKNEIVESKTKLKKAKEDMEALGDK